MGWFGASDPDESARREAAEARAADWRSALERHRLPGFVRERLTEAGAGRVPWMSTLTPAELLLARSHGLRPLATVSGTCWYHYGWSWTEGHAEGWHLALDRLRQEAVAAGANAVVDVKLRTVTLPGTGDSMDYTVVGTAVRLDGLPPSPDPVIATVPAIAFVRLLEAGIVPTGVAIGARYDWLTVGSWNAAGTSGLTGLGSRGGNGELGELGRFWEDVRRQAIDDLRRDTARLGDGVLAHTHFAQLLKREAGENQPVQLLGRHIVLGTAVQCGGRDPVPHDIDLVVDMRDALSPLHGEAPHGHTVYGARTDEEGAI
jgi:uncharacterized protein YbjQ (UPF0145 family)